VTVRSAAIPGALALAALTVPLGCGAEQKGGLPLCKEETG
jgi:hypothetical protein